MSLERKDKIEILENAISYIVIFAMFIYGGAKIIQFEGAIKIGKTVNEMTGMELMWAFYGYSKSYAIALGIIEIIGGTLMLLKRTRILGCIFVTTILVNIILQDIFYGVNFGALRAAILYQVLILIILWINKDKLLDGIRVLTSHNKYDQLNYKLLIKVILSIILFVLFRILEFYITLKL